jgi:hypothetical protein
MSLRDNQALSLIVASTGGRPGPRLRLMVGRAAIALNIDLESDGVMYRICPALRITSHPIGLSEIQIPTFEAGLVARAAKQQRHRLPAYGGRGRLFAGGTSSGSIRHQLKPWPASSSQRGSRRRVCAPLCTWRFSECLDQKLSLLRHEMPIGVAPWLGSKRRPR